MKTGMSAGIIVALILSSMLAAPSAVAQDWSLKKINPFGKQEKEDKQARRTTLRNKESTAKSASKPLRSLTPAGVKENLGNLGRSTSDVWAKTKSALTPKTSLPRIKLPGLSRRDERSGDAAAKKKSSSPFKLTSWVFPRDKSERSSE